MPSDAPLADAAAAFLREPGTTFTVPGHKRAPGLGDPLLAYDLPLVSGADDSRMTRGVLAQAEALAAELWGADVCRFSVAGSTHGNQTLALTVGTPGDRVIVSRTMHKSVFAGLVLAGLQPVWVYPRVDPATGLALTIEPAEIERALAIAPDARGVFLVEPSYIGMISDLEAIAGLVHEAGMPLLIDQAWGAHLGFHPALPKHALARGADALVTSTHKNLTAFTQGSVVLARGERLDLARFDHAFELLHTTSPSAAILASSDRARQLMADRGAELLGRTVELAADARRRLAEVQGLLVLDASDPTKLVLGLAGTGADGFEVEAALERAGIRPEMCDRDTIVPILTVADTDTTVARLVNAVTEAIEEHRGPPRQPSASSVWSLAAETALDPREAFFAARERVDAEQAVGRISAETAAPYPPGIPALAPGEVITEPILRALQAEAAAGSRIAYCSDPSLRTLVVVSDGFSVGNVR